MNLTQIFIIITLQSLLTSNQHILSHQKNLIRKRKTNYLKKRMLKKIIKPENFTLQIFSGKWKSKNLSQNNFLEKKSGIINLAFDYFYGKEEYINFAFEFYEGNFLDNKFIFG